MAEPKVRFKRDNGSNYPSWENLLMSEIFTEISEKNHSEMPVLSILQGVGTVLRDSSDRNILYDKSNLKNYKVIKKDDYIIHLRSFEGGLECSNYDGISSPAYRILRPQRIVPLAYRDYFRSYEFIHNKLAVSVVGIRDGKNIDMDTFWQISMSIPCIEEQQKIANFLSSVDEVIATSEQEIANLEMQKKAVMKKIFSREVRFKKDDGSDFPDWEIMPLEKIIYLIVDNRGKTPPLSNSGYPLIEIPAVGEYYLQYEKIEKRVSQEVYNTWFRKHLEKGDLLFSTVGNTAQCSIYDEKEKCCVAQNIIGIRFNSDIDSRFMFNVLSYERNQKNIKTIQMNGVQSSIKVSQFVKIPFFIPCFEEQCFIADFLSGFDEAIALAKKELELWKELKKGLLQQMFV